MAHNTDSYSLTKDMYLALEKANHIINHAKIESLDFIDEKLTSYPQLINFHIKDHTDCDYEFIDLPPSLLIASIQLSKKNEEVGLKFIQYFISKGSHLNITKEDEAKKKISPIMYAFNKSTLFLLMQQGAKFTDKEYEKFKYMINSDVLNNNPLKETIIELVQYYDAHQAKIKLENILSPLSSKKQTVKI